MVSEKIKIFEKYFGRVFSNIYNKQNYSVLIESDEKMIFVPPRAEAAKIANKANLFFQWKKVDSLLEKLTESQRE